MVAHAVLVREMLLTHQALIELLIGVQQLVLVQVVDVAEGVAAHLTGVVLLDVLS